MVGGACNTWLQSAIPQIPTTTIAPFLHSPPKHATILPPPPSFSLPRPKTHNQHRHFCTTTTTQHLFSSSNHNHHHHQQQQQQQPLFPLTSLSESSSAPLLDNFDTIYSLLRRSVHYTGINVTKALHVSILKLHEDTHLGNALIVAYLKQGFVLDAYKVFNGLSCPDVVSYSSLISAFAKSNREIEAAKLFCRMRRSGVEPNEYSFVAILTACVRSLESHWGLQIHVLVIKMGYLDSVFVANALMGLYSKCGDCLDNVLKLFYEMPQRDIASWNTVISSVVKELMYEKAFGLFRDMQRSDGFRVDHFTLSTLLTACTGSNTIMEGREAHAHAIRIGLENHLSVNNALMGFYTKYGSVKDVVALFERLPVRDIITWTEMVMAYMEFGLVEKAVETFNRMPERNSVSYNALLAGLCRNGEVWKALDLFIKMTKEGAELTDFTLTSVLNACGTLTEVKISEQIHGFIVKFGFGSNACIEAALLDMCTRCGRMLDAEKMLLRWPPDQDSSVIQTSMICGYARNGQPDEAMSVFLRSQLEGTMIMDEVASTSVLGVCGTLGFHEIGELIHCHAIKTGLSSDLGVGNSIISMYSKSYNMNGAIKAFNNMPRHDIVSWNCLIAGHLLHRHGDEALAVWSRMEQAGLKPDAITFVLIISAYRHTNSNLVDDCRTLFLSMIKTYYIEPTLEHYASFAGVLGYWGLLEEAEEMIIKMPFEPKASAWRALLDTCRIHLNTSIGKRVAKRIIAIEPQDPSMYVLVSNLYSASGRWHCSEMVRDDMRKRGFRKHPARSWVIQKCKVHSFYARDKSHPQAKDIYSGLEILLLECLKSGYVPDTSFVLHEVEEHQKKTFLFYHSAKLAATCGLLMTKQGEPIRVVKNILLCGDCHTFLKYASLVSSRDILLRDTSGFHCFSNGHCSCKDYW
ncbi:PPR domain-containing protein/PPR_2 domain-containing protein/DYW_deaminase domain-containing protein [Cephalotus follicularis]|uniref:PPR domain-containing protein/PPR_2 domain-containing protein/DYW_deaminase domain-containing protein n=1 Tax=Cephalotus follicularis TaxID=3775 RepID=A0A1Q3DH44_CEPFO|nr:PPR domain-containing protein/PPR_2 domain-containing protein/DYW_deaminase domain-containing protein [Cephalotus follicularis]